MRKRRTGGTWRWLFLAHAATVAVLTVLFLALDLTTAPADGANLGAGIVALPLLPLGLPWSLPVIVNPYRFDDLSRLGWYVVTLGPAVLNVALHAVVLAVVRARHQTRRRDR